MFDSFVREESMIPRGNYFETSFDALTTDPIGTLREMYNHLRLPDFPEFEPTLAEHLRVNSNYEKTRHSELPQNVRQRIDDEAKDAFARWHYHRGSV
jgi:hypothetical protein